MVDEALRNREYKDFNDRLNSIEFKNYLQGIGDPGTRLMFKFRSGNGLNEKFWVKSMIKSVNYIGMNVRVWYMYSRSVLYNYGSIRNTFIAELEKLLGRSFEEFSTLNNFNKVGFSLGRENWDRYRYNLKP